MKVAFMRHLNVQLEKIRRTVLFVSVGTMKRLTILHTIETAGPGGAETYSDLALRLDTARFRSIALLPREDWLSND